MYVRVVLWHGNKQQNERLNIISNTLQTYAEYIKAMQYLLRSFVNSIINLPHEARAGTRSVIVDIKFRKNRIAHWQNVGDGVF